MIATNQLRFEERKLPIQLNKDRKVIVAPRTIRILQQLWVNEEHELYNSEWKDVPVVKGEAR